LSDDLDALNERIAELEHEGHRGACHGRVEGERLGFCPSNR
jgi:hypothetical protein